MAIGLSLVPWAWFQWTYLKYFNFGEGSQTNLLDFGFMIHPAMTIFFFMFLLTVLPIFAYFEEIIFRRGTRNWLDGTWRSILFGFAMK